MRSLCLLLSCAMLAGCSHDVIGGLSTVTSRIEHAPVAHDPQPPLERRPSHYAEPLNFVYDFKGSPDGEQPLASLINIGSTLYGTTSFGGAGNFSGTVFKIAARRESVLYSFGTGGDGDASYPVAELTDVNGTLYGTAQHGGANNEGAVFAVTLYGKERIVYSFSNNGGSDGFQPVAGLVNVNGALYGTTFYTASGCRPCGTVFKVTRTGKESIIHAFTGNPDGATSTAALINFDGTLYGTTQFGGRSNDGTVFAITPSGKERVIYSFKGGADGEFPAGALLDANGIFYGTTENGGEFNEGTVFKIAGSGTESVIYSFKGGSDGGSPVAPVVSVDGSLYGTTSVGGTDNNGTVYKISPSGVASILYSFTGGADGGGPAAGLINVNGTLYGTAAYGNNGYGTVFGIRVK